MQQGPTWEGYFFVNGRFCCWQLYKKTEASYTTLISPAPHICAPTPPSSTWMSDFFIARSIVILPKDDEKPLEVVSSRRL